MAKPSRRGMREPGGCKPQWIKTSVMRDCGRVDFPKNHFRGHTVDVMPGFTEMGGNRAPWAKPRSAQKSTTNSRDFPSVCLQWPQARDGGAIRVPPRCHPLSFIIFPTWSSGQAVA